MPTTLLLGEDMPSIKTEQLTLIKGSSIKDVRTNLGIFGTPLSLPKPVHIRLTTRPLPVFVDTRLALFETLQFANN